MCNNGCGCGFGGNSCSWVIILLIIWVVCGNGFGGCGGGCGCGGCGDGCNNNGCGC